MHLENSTMKVLYLSQWFHFKKKVPLYEIVLTSCKSKESWKPVGNVGKGIGGMSTRMDEGRLVRIITMVKWKHKDGLPW